MEKHPYLLLLATMMTWLIDRSLASLTPQIPQTTLSPSRSSPFQRSQQQQQALLYANPSSPQLSSRPMSPSMRERVADRCHHPHSQEPFHPTRAISPPALVRTLSPPALTRAMSPSGSSMSPRLRNDQLHLSQQPFFPPQSQAFSNPSGFTSGASSPNPDRMASFMPLDRDPMMPHLERSYSTSGFQSPTPSSRQLISSDQSGTPPLGSAPLFSRLPSGSPSGPRSFSDPSKEHKNERASPSTRVIQNPRALGGSLPSGVRPYSSSNYMHLFIPFLYYIPNLRYALYQICSYTNDEIIPAFSLAMNSLQQANHDRTPMIAASSDLGPLFEQYLDSTDMDEPARALYRASLIGMWNWLWSAMDARSRFHFTFSYDLRVTLQNSGTSPASQLLHQSTGNSSAVIAIKLNNLRDNDLQQWITRRCSTGHPSNILLRRGFSAEMNAFLEQNGETTEFAENTWVNGNSSWEFTTLPTNLLFHLDRPRQIADPPYVQIDHKPMSYQHELVVPLTRMRLEGESEDHEGEICPSYEVLHSLLPQALPPPPQALPSPLKLFLLLLFFFLLKLFLFCLLKLLPFSKPSIKFYIDKSSTSILRDCQC